MTQPDTLDPQDQITLTATPAGLYEADISAYLANQMTGNLLCVSEDFSTETDSEDGVQCMLSPTAIFCAAEGPGLTPKGLWGASLDVIEAASRAYFAASASADVNHLILTAIQDMEDVAESSSYKAFHFAGAIVVTTDDPFGDGNIDAKIRVFIDSTQSAHALLRTYEALSVFLSRLANFLGYENIDIQVVPAV
jgi:hypothetical protein